MDSGILFIFVLSRFQLKISDVNCGTAFSLMCRPENGEDLICTVQIYNRVSVTAPLTIPAGGQRIGCAAAARECYWAWFMRGSALNGMLTLRSAIVQLKTHEINLKRTPASLIYDSWSKQRKNSLPQNSRKKLRYSKLRTNYKQWTGHKDPARYILDARDLMDLWWSILNGIVVSRARNDLVVSTS